jgi:hypothetical protein
LIGGTSHVGKSTLARVLAARRGWSCRSTDTLARHPGRPWRTPPEQMPPHVSDHYRTLAPESLLADVLRHHRDTVWPLAERLIVSHTTEPQAGCLVLEGSALLPELVGGLRGRTVAALWLTAGDDLITRRIHGSSGYATKTESERELIDKFATRSRLFNRHVVLEVSRWGLLRVDAGEGPDELAEACLSALRDRS